VAAEMGEGSVEGSQVAADGFDVDSARAHRPNSPRIMRASRAARILAS
jgi:hypothetical protein